MSPSGTYIVWGPELSPFLLKLESLLAYAGLPSRRLPRDGGRLEALRSARRVVAAKRARTAVRPPSPDLDPLDPATIGPARAWSARPSLQRRRCERQLSMNLTDASAARMLRERQEPTISQTERGKVAALVGDGRDLDAVFV